MSLARIWTTVEAVRYSFRKFWAGNIAKKLIKEHCLPREKSFNCSWLWWMLPATNKWYFGGINWQVETHLSLKSKMRRSHHKDAQESTHSSYDDTAGRTPPQNHYDKQKSRLSAYTTKSSKNWTDSIIGSHSLDCVIRSVSYFRYLRFSWGWEKGLWEMSLFSLTYRCRIIIYGSPRQLTWRAAFWRRAAKRTALSRGW